jgi:hypothetical protein
MAKRISIKRLRDKYGEYNIKNEKYQQVINDILMDNTEAITTQIFKISDRTWKKETEKIIDRKTKRPITLTFPEFKTIIPNKRAFSIKAAESGRMITQTLRNHLNVALRESIQDFEKEGTRYRGRLRPEIIRKMKSKVKDVFVNYQKTDPRYGVPSNIRNIAVTEVRSNVNMIREKYVETFMFNNKKKIEMKKQWIQNISQSKEPRKSHNFVNKKIIGFYDFFEFPEYKKIKGQWKKTGKTIRMSRPHDPAGGTAEIIGCNCELRYIAKSI